MFKGVLTIEMMVLTLFFIIFSKRRAKATKGMIWPCAMKGNITIFRFLGFVFVISDEKTRSVVVYCRLGNVSDSDQR